MKLKLFSLFFGFSGRAGGTKRESGQVGAETAASAYVCVYIINEERARGGSGWRGGDDKWL